MRLDAGIPVQSGGPGGAGRGLPQGGKVAAEVSDRMPRYGATVSAIAHAKAGYRQALFKTKSPGSREVGGFLLASVSLSLPLTFAPLPSRNQSTPSGGAYHPRNPRASPLWRSMFAGMAFARPGSARNYCNRQSTSDGPDRFSHLSAADQRYRETDFAIDYCEDVPALPLAAAERIAALMRKEGLNARISSI